MELILWQVLMADPDEEEEEVGVSEYQTLEDLVREAKEAKEQEARDKVVCYNGKNICCCTENICPGRDGEQDQGAGGVPGESEGRGPAYVRLAADAQPRQSLRSW